MVHAIDPDKKGAILWQTRAAKGGYLGGSQWGSASDGQNSMWQPPTSDLVGCRTQRFPEDFALLSTQSSAEDCTPWI